MLSNMICIYNFKPYFFKYVCIQVYFVESMTFNNLISILSCFFITGTIIAIALAWSCLVDLISNSR